MQHWVLLKCDVFAATEGIGALTAKEAKEGRGKNDETCNWNFADDR